ncbi:hypothetical protein [Nonomuraea sp. NEAU-A123]|uniref:HAAS signaling domain-containing protein n=1 Tax=Nonomuraea sp. NEAU-A123 TaxID=2839649 RepID=UPI001BE4C9FC|nr:hypothetical protein [Nonomuraea sp. NEAU-A123]MBT2229935.1 hypothetical protein [Nonomuraea sp. NEAU-A123]
MTYSTDPLDRLVEDYLAEVARATAALPAGQREDLIADLREHITVARADLDPPTQAGIRTILDRLGEPAAIAEEARQGEPVTAASSTYSPAPPTFSQSAAPQRSSPSTPALILGVVLVLIVILVGACAVTLFADSPDDDALPVINSRTSQTAPAPR